MAKRTKYDWSPSEWAEYYDRLRHKNEMSYQDSGEPRYERAQYQYEQITDAADYILDRLEEKENK